ncbi:MAG TPA: response regulator transcription factor [Dehalococcoidia bacterium]|nr:response regulator transcription factor [Dehalococcoidia bacterium]HLB28598.1 response regulator transcription factor [Dehalococcoidia bacterium]
MSVVRVLIVDDHSVVRAGIRYVLEELPDVRVVGEAGSGEEAMAKAQELQPEIMFVDIGMTGMSGIELTRRVKELLPEVKVLILTMHEETEYFFAALQAGAAGYVVKGADSEELITAFRAVQRDGVFLYPSLAKVLVTDYLQEKKTAAYDGLTPREREVLALIAEGLTNKEIGLRLSIGVTTVQTHRTHIMDKLGLHTQADLIRYALRKGIIPS